MVGRLVGIRPGKRLRKRVCGRSGFRAKLAPGKSMETFVCTDPTDANLTDSLRRAKGKMLTWRVQVRCGPVVVEERRNPVPCTAVIASTSTKKRSRTRNEPSDIRKRLCFFGGIRQEKLDVRAALA